MISKQDCMLLLTEIGATDKLKELISLEAPTVELIEFINKNRELDLTKFYTKIRKSYNNKKSKLYINIVKETEDPTKVLTTLSALLTQILLFSDSCTDKAMFLRHSRAAEITVVLKNYFTTYDLTACIKLLKLIKADVKVCDAMYRAE